MRLTLYENATQISKSHSYKAAGVTGSLADFLASIPILERIGRASG